MEHVRKLLTRVFDIRPGEVLRTFLMFSYLLSIIGCYITTKSVRDSLFLKKIGADQLPYVYMVIALVVGVISSVYSKAARRATINQLTRYTSLIAISNLLIFWWVLKYHWSWMFYVLYIWVSIFGVITASQFWLLANYVFNPREAKRLFALIGAGGVLGGIFGGYFTKFGALWFGTENLLLWCMGFIGISILLLERVTKEAQLLSDTGQLGERGLGAEVSSGETQRLLKMILSSKHLTMLAAILGITVVIESFIDYQFKFLSDQSFDSQDRLTSFFGTLFAYLGMFSLFFQIFLTGRILKRFGVGISILFLPVGLFIGSLALAFVPSLLAVAFLKISDGSFRYSIHRSGIELLYLPVPLKIKNQVKGFIDMFVDRLGRGVGGLLLLLFTTVLPFSITHLSLFVCGLVFVWIVLSITIRREYLNSFRLALEKKTIEPEMLRVRISDSATLQALLNVLQSPDERQVLYAMHLLADANSVSWLPHLRSLVKHSSAKVRALAIETLASIEDRTVFDVVTERLKDPDFGVRAEAVRYLCTHNQGNPLVKIKEFLQSKDYVIVGAAIHCMAKYRWQADPLIDQTFIEDALREEGERRELARITAASALGLIEPSSPLQRYLPALLQDSSSEVVRHAVRSAGQTLCHNALPLLIQKLADPKLRSDAREALLRYGPEIVGTLSDYLNNPGGSMAVRANIPKLLALMGRQEAADCLILSIHQSDQFLEYRVIKALNRMRVNYAELAFDDQMIDSLILQELRDYYQFGLMLRLSHSEKDRGNAAWVLTETRDSQEGWGVKHRGHTALKILNKALQERMDQKLERVFRLLGLRYPPNDIYSAYYGIRSNKSHLRASAIEFLDNLLLPNLKQLLVPILEEAAVESYVQKASRLLGIEMKSKNVYLDHLIKGRDPWLKTIAIYVAGSLGLVELAGAIGDALHAPDPFIRETAQWSWTLLKSPEVLQGYTRS